MEVSLPQEVIEHIQSFIQGKEAVRTAILSKSVYNAWLKRPNLEFDERLFPDDYTGRFSKFTKQTMQRYEDSKLNIETFTLRMTYNSAFLKELMTRAMELGVINLNIIVLRNSWLPNNFVLPVEVLGSKTLASLSMTGGMINLSDEEVTYSPIKSLHLSHVNIIGDLFRSLISRCPLIEKLVCDANFLSFSNVRCENEFRNLESLSLNTLRNRDALFFQDLFVKFPFLKNLAIQHIYDCGNIRICSQSLLCISIIEYYRAVTMEIDAPNIRRFHFEGSPLSCFTFEKTVSHWESDIRVMCYQPSSSWLSSLRFSLLKLSQSTVYLSVYVKYPSKYICDGRYEPSPSPVVENLKCMEHAPNSGLLDGLFMICRPKFVNVAPGKTELLELLCKKLVDRTSENDLSIPIPNPSVHGLEEVNLEVYDQERIGEWRPLSLKTLLDASAYHQITKELRFQLRWRPEICAS